MATKTTAVAIIDAVRQRGGDIASVLILGYLQTRNTFAL
jgi:hypothetical protein